MQWDLFCRVIDNFGDVGVCWRLAADLAARGKQVRLWVDDARALAWMAPSGAPGVTVQAWPTTAAELQVEPGAVVVEAFGCSLPAGFVARMAAAPRAPCWINLEYLSAEDWVERCHGLASPQSDGPGAGLRKWFFYPGFTSATGGLLREPDLLARRSTFDRSAWLAAKDLTPDIGERVVSLFCYSTAALPALLDELARTPTLLLATDGLAASQVTRLLGARGERGHLRARSLPALTQRDFDHLLWAADLNFVRGEDSFVRAQWAGQPFVWQIYPQEDEAHRAKLDAFLDRFPADATMRRCWHAWNDATGGRLDLGDLAGWRVACERWRASLLLQDDLVTQLTEFVAERG